MQIVKGIFIGIFIGIVLCNTIKCRYSISAKCKDIYSKIRKYLKTKMEQFKRKLICVEKYFHRIIWWVKRCITHSEIVCPGKNNKEYEYKDLAPLSDVKNASEYFAALDWAFNNKSVKNIAITGPYGSGKSSIIQSYIKNHPEMKVINISLANFLEYTEDGNGQLVKLKGNDLEAGILKQLFYKVNHKKIPRSRYRKLYKLKGISVFKYVLALVLLSIGISVYAIDDLESYINTFLSIAQKNLSLEKKTIGLIGILLIILCMIYISYIVWKAFSKISIKEVNIADKATISASEGEGAEKSIFNKNLDEIVYFFEETKYNVVFIEDLDRFKNSDIFVKLRELNTILNQYEMIKERIVFVYAVKDDMFTDKDRTKFFEFILPVIPIINSTNSAEMLLEKMRQKDGTMKFDITEDYITLIAPYIDDMRVLNNIYNEFLTYKRTLKGSQNLNLSDQLMFSLMVFKNLYPKDFAELQAEKGIVKDAFAEKRNITSRLKSDIEQEKQALVDYISKLDKEIFNDIKEIKAAMLYYMTDNLGIFRNVTINGRTYNAHEILKDQFDVEVLRAYGSVSYYSSGTNIANLQFDGKTKFIGAKDYISRCKYLIDSISGRKSELQLNVEQKDEEIRKLSAISLKELLEVYDVKEVLPEKVRNNKLLVFMLRYGFIDEKYPNYMNYFHENSITKGDMNFILSIRNRVAEEFNYPLTETKQVVSRLLPYEFEQKEAYNFDLLDCILSEEDYSEQCDLFIKQLSDESDLSWKFINEYIDKTCNEEVFIKKLCSKWNNIGDYILAIPTLSTERKDKFLRMICMYADIDDILQINKNESVSRYFTDNPDILRRMNLVPVERIKSTIEQCKIKFSSLDVETANKELLDWIFDGDYYEITLPMIFSIFAHKKYENMEMLTKRNYSTVLELGYKPLLNRIYETFENYINKMVLEIEENTEETLEATLDIIERINNLEIIKQLIKKENVCLDSLLKCKFDNLDEAGILGDVWNEWMNSKKLLPTWENLIAYWEVKGITHDLLIFIEGNVEKFSDEVISSELDPAMIREMIQSDIKASILEVLIEKLPLSNWDIPFENILGENLRILIEHNYFNVTSERVTELREVYPELVSTYIMQNKEDVIENLENYSFEINEIEIFLTSNGLSSKEKLRFVAKCDHEEMTVPIAIFLSGLKEHLNKQLFDSAWCVLDKSMKYKLFLNQIEALSKGDRISECLKDLDSPYQKFADNSRRHEVKLVNSEYNLELVIRLKQVGYITSYKVIQNIKEDIITHEKKCEEYLSCWIKKV